MSRKPFHPPAAAALLAGCVLTVFAACDRTERPASDQPGGQAAAPTGKVSRFAEDTSLSDPERRYRALIPLLQQVAEGKAHTELPFTETASRVGVAEADLRMWYDLYDNLGRTGLITPGTPSIPDMAAQMEGTWSLSGRMIEGRPAEVTAEMHIKVAEVSDARAVLEMLILEEGIHHSWGPHSAGTDKPFAIGAFFRVGLTRGGQGQVVVDTDLNGEVLAENYPGLDSLTSVQVLQNLVRMGETYTAVRAGNVVTGSAAARQVLGEDIWNYVNGVDGMALSYGSFRDDTYDTNIKVSQTPLIAEPRAHWEQVKQSRRTELLHPQRQSEIQRLRPQRRRQQ